MSRLGNAYLVYNLCRFLRENMARVDKERGLSRFICIFAWGGHLQNGRLKVAEAGHHRELEKKGWDADCMRCKYKTNTLQLRHKHSVMLTLKQNICNPNMIESLKIKIGVLKKIISTGPSISKEGLGCTPQMLNYLLFDQKKLKGLNLLKSWNPDIC